MRSGCRQCATKYDHMLINLRVSLAAEEEDSFHSLVVEEEIEVPQAVSVGIRIQVRVVTDGL